MIAAQWHGAFSESSKHSYEDSTGSYPLSEVAGGEKALASLATMIRALRQKDKKVFLVLGIPTGIDFNPRFMIQRKTFTRDWGIKEALVDREFVSKNIPTSALKLRSLGAATGATIIDPMDTLCNERECRSRTQDGALMYKDSSHLSATFVRNHILFFDDVLKISKP